jgi:HSP20 family protein
MNKLFSDFGSGASFLPDFFTEPLVQIGEKLVGFTPNVNVTKSDRALVITVEVPGMDERDIELSLTKEALTIRGERKQSHDTTSEGEGESKWSYTESSFGAFERIVPLGELIIDEDGVEATASKGIVTISLPIRSGAETGVKKVSIRSA